MRKHRQWTLVAALVYGLTSTSAQSTADGHDIAAFFRNLAEYLKENPEDEKRAKTMECA